MYNDQQKKEFDSLKKEIARLKKIIEWYEATYERRSILGIIKSKLVAKKRNQFFFTKIKIKFENLFKKLNNSFIRRETKLTTEQAILKLRELTFCAIANHNNNANAKLLSNTFSRYLTTQVIDSGSAVKEKEFINLPNVYYSGLYNYAYEYAKSNNYQYLLFICSDVIVDVDEAEKMFQNLTLIKLEDIGVYSPASTGRSHYQCKKKNEGGFRIVDFVEGFFFFANMKVLEKFSKIDIQLNPYGWGIDVAKGFYSKKMGLLSIIDDSISIHHPDKTGYSISSAEDQMTNWFGTLEFGNEILAFHENRVQLIRSGAEDNMKISVIVPCYNQVEYLKECIYSIFSQTYSNYEIIIINDGSTDGTDELVTSLTNIFNQVKYVKQNNQGLGATRNKGLDIAQGDYIQFLDADDYVSENKFNTAIQAFINDPQLDIAYSQYVCFQDGDPDKKWTYSRVELMDPPIVDLITEWERALSIPVHCFLFKREIINNSRFDITLPNHEDWEFHLTIASKTPSYSYTPEATAYYRMKKVAMSQNKELMKDGKNRCIANLISSQKIQHKHLPALYERLDYRIVVGIISCKKNVEKIKAIRNTWLRDLNTHQIPYYIVMGDPSINACKLENDILYVPCADNYESLPQKVLELYQFIYEKTTYDFVYKIDDDCFLNIENLFSTYFWNFNYFGRTVATKEEDLDRSWHSGKCSDQTLNKTAYSRPYSGPWCGGGYGYFLSREAIKNICNMADYVQTDLYEDKAIGDVLRKKKITAEENVRYRVLDITEFNINDNDNDEDEFKKIVDQIGYSILDYEAIINLQKEFQFKMIQNKKMNLIADITANFNKS
jgi:glycosyltransferase involved in cell wall biosynthesis